MSRYLVSPPPAFEMIVVNGVAPRIAMFGCAMLGEPGSCAEVFCVCTPDKVSAEAACG